MFHRKSILRFAIVPTILMIVASATTLSFGTTTMRMQAQNTATPEQIKDYLTQAMQALDSGNNTKAAEQVSSPEEQLKGMTGTEVEDENGEDEEEEGEVEDEDEPGDVETT
jgi:hypothetical protein